MTKEVKERCLTSLSAYIHCIVFATLFSLPLWFLYDHELTLEQNWAPSFAFVYFPIGPLLCMAICSYRKTSNMTEAAIAKKTLTHLEEALFSDLPFLLSVIYMCLVPFAMTFIGYNW